ncbi:complement factor H-related protein 4-like isoform X1 [Myotis myotis]|uniref:Complement factor H related 2 n=2 Tax=Myotis myotis TaxID=51298 RepID=A0A7J7RUU4_MYOMY|nr:complement factor H-related protein 4-like isoform X1 [Myotis myotis]KAF6279694.1 complement factor H related 2 [Myotis myotis]KAF6279695.1 complement factor H related 2 [Myotis myotis]KAF6279696.1 complement factor H related 2 [Myotis myotis]
MQLLVTVILTLWVSWARGQEITCDPPLIENSHYIPKRTNYELGQEITYYCTTGFFPSSRGNTATCTDKGWDPPPRCSLNPCELPKLKHGLLYKEDTYRSYFPAPIKQWFYYSCDENYVTPPESFWHYITCTQDGWTPEVPCLRKCVFNDLKHVRTPPKEQRLLQGQSIKIDCLPGYSLLNPQSTVTCTEKGWSSLPRCIKHCDMPTFENARAVITGRPFRLNDTLDYQCLDGYENRDGSTNGTMVCGEDGWLHLPTCFKSADKCGPPPPINYGAITSIPLEVYPPWSRVEYQCQDYYELRGPQYVTCSSAKWSEPPRCIVPCVISEKIMNAKNIQIKGKNDKTYYAKTGDIIDFMCKSGRKAATSKESFQAMCLEGTVEFPICE